MKSELKIYVCALGRDFLTPYLRRAMPDAVLTESAAEADRCVMISSTDIYAPAQGSLMDESTATDTSSEWAAYEAEFTAACRAACRQAFILRSADIVGTGMTGRPRKLAEMIWRGTLFHFKGNEARVSAVHATDVAAAMAAVAALPVETGGIFNITDGDNPMFRDYVDSLACRMKDKRVSTLSTRGQLWLGRLLYGRKLYGSFTQERTFDCAALCRLIDYKPTPVTRYLRTHVYDDSSL